MGISTSAYYYKPRLSLEERQKQDADLRDKIEAIHIVFPRAGYRVIYHHFLRQGERINKKRILRVMKEYGLKPLLTKAFKTKTTDSNHDYKVYPNLMKDKVLTGINQAWGGDITYIRIATCFVYLAEIMDLFSRRIIGWAISKSLHRNICIEALKMAIDRRNPPPGCIHHTDQGVQYACNEYITILKDSHFEISMSAKGNPYDNAFLESFMKTFKYEEVHLNNYEIYEDVIERVPYFLEDVYNTKRLHSGLGYLPPEEFEDFLLKKDENECTKN